MGSLGKGLALVLILTIAISTLSLLVIRPAQNRTIVVSDDYYSLSSA
jgi:hypothetical protein